MNPILKPLLALITCSAIGLAAASPSVAAPSETFRGDYTVSFLGFTVARSTFVSTVAGDDVTVKGTLSSAGIGTFFDSTSGTTSFDGKIGPDAVLPTAYQTKYTSGKKNKSTSIQFANGNVTKTLNVPPLKKRAKWVPLRAGDLNGVLDPISATMVRADNSADVCKRTLKVYDGEMRANIVLSPASTGKVAGFGPEAVTCSAKFVPVSGYRPDSSSLNYLKTKSRISISFAPMGDTGLYAPVRASIGTKVGTVTMVARRTKD